MGLPLPPSEDAPFLPADTFANDIILITGGGTGLGKAMAKGFARLGGAVAIASRNPDHLRSGVEAVEAVGGKAIAVGMNVRSAEAVAAAFDEVEQRLGPITILINNAAANFPVPSEELSPNGWRAVLQTTLDGAFFCATEFARRRIAAGGGGAVLNIGASYAWTGGPGAAHNAAAKAGAMSLVQSLAVEWAPDGIRVNGLCPGIFPHEDQPQTIKDLPGRADMGRRIPAHRVGELHELAWMACFMCSPYAAYLTGHNAVLDGGNWLRRTLHLPVFEPVRDWARSKAPETD